MTYYEEIISKIRSIRRGIYEKFDEYIQARMEEDTHLSVELRREIDLLDEQLEDLFYELDNFSEDDGMDDPFYLPKETLWDEQLTPTRVEYLEGLRRQKTLKCCDWRLLDRCHRDHCGEDRRANGKGRKPRRSYSK